MPRGPFCTGAGAAARGHDDGLFCGPGRQRLRAGGAAGLGPRTLKRKDWVVRQPSPGVEESEKSSRSGEL